MMINDEYETRKGKLVLSLESKEGRALASTERDFEIPGLGQQSYKLNLNLPGASGAYVLKATAYPEGGKTPTVSRRTVSLPEDVKNPRQSKALGGKRN